MKSSELDKNLFRHVRHPELSADAPLLIYVSHHRARRDTLTGDAHEALQMCLPLAGEVEFVCPFDNYSRRKQIGEVFMSSCWEEHSVRPTHAYSVLLTMTFSLETLAALPTFSELKWVSPFLVDMASRPSPTTRAERLEIARLGRRIVQLERRRPFAFRSAQWLLVQEILMTLTRNWRMEGIDERHNRVQRIFPAIIFLNRNIDKIVGIEDVAAACGMGRSAFCASFREAMGIGFGQYARRVRMSKAAHLLRRGSLDIKEVARQVGFNDNGNFYRSFGDYFGVTPSRFRSGNVKAPSDLGE